MANYSRDLTDKQWELIRHNFDYGNYGKSCKYPIRTLVNTVFYVLRPGCQWRMLLRLNGYRRLSKDYEI